MATNGGTMSEGAGRLEEEAGLGARMETLRAYASTAEDLVRDFARERPVAAVAIAVGVGFVLGRLAART